MNASAEKFCSLQQRHQTELRCDCSLSPPNLQTGIFILDNVYVADLVKMACGRCESGREASKAMTCKLLAFSKQNSTKSSDKTIEFDDDL